MREMKQTMAAVLSLTLACTLLIAPAEGQAAKKKMKLNKTKATLYVGKKLTLKVKNTKKKVKWSSCTDPQMLDQKSNDWRSIFLWLNIVLNLKRK